MGWEQVTIYGSFPGAVGDHLRSLPRDGFYLAVVLDLFSRQVIGWPMRARIDSELRLPKCHSSELLTRVEKYPEFEVSAR